METFKIDSKTEILLKKNDWDVIENGVLQDSMPKSLFKFFSLNKFSLDSLFNGYVYLSNPKDFNDPFDCNRNLIIEKQKTHKDWQYVEVLNDISGIGISSFSENSMEPLLWSHYAESYHGFCLKINPEVLIKKNSEFVKLKKVIYSDKPKSISLYSNFADYYQYILKLDNWSYEKEWRLLFENPKNIDNKYYFDKDCIEEILIGYKFMETGNSVEKTKFKDQFEEFRKSKFKNIPLFTVGPHQTKLELQKTLLKEGTFEDAIEMIKHNFGISIK